MKQYSFLLICFMSCFSLCGCQSGLVEKFSAHEIPSDWIGETPIALISSKGSPTQIINANGMQYLIYMTAKSTTFGESEGEISPGQFTMNESGFPRSSSINMPYCQMTFIVENGLIVRAEEQGTACSTVPDMTQNPEFK